MLGDVLFMEKISDTSIMNYMDCMELEQELKEINEFIARYESDETPLDVYNLDNIIPTYAGEEDTHNNNNFMMHTIGNLVDICEEPTESTIDSMLKTDLLQYIDIERQELPVFNASEEFMQNEIDFNIESTSTPNYKMLEIIYIVDENRIPEVICIEDENRIPEVICI